MELAVQQHGSELLFGGSGKFPVDFLMLPTQDINKDMMASLSLRAELTQTFPKGMMDARVWPIEVIWPQADLCH